MTLGQDRRARIANLFPDVQSQPCHMIHQKCYVGPFDRLELRLQPCFTPMFPQNTLLKPEYVLTVLFITIKHVFC